MQEQPFKRKAAYPIDDLYIDRWSPRAFADKEVDQDTLFSLFEAARWAPSAANMQPWRFVYAQSSPDRDQFLSFINDGNTIWCKHAPVLIAVIAHTRWSEDREDINPTHAFDTGTAWGFLALEARRKGLITHGMGGFDRKKAAEVLQVPDGHTVLAIIAVGYHGEKSSLSEALQQREKPSDRKPVEAFVHEGIYTKEM